MSQQINLFNPIFLKQRKIFSALQLVEALGLVAAGSILLFFYVQSRVAETERLALSGKQELAAREAKLAKVNKEFAPRARSQTLQDDIARKQSEVAALNDVHKVLKGGALGNTTGYAQYFRAFAHQNVRGLWLTGIAIAGAGNEISVRGRAMQPDLVPGYIARLAHEPALRGTTFGSLQIGRPSEAAAQAALPAAAAPMQAEEQTSPWVEFTLQSRPVEAVK